ncbi:MAG: hypothetical protein ACOYKD_10075 [Anaerolineaceae bacterium]|jgi:hypothetical protein
MKTYKLDQTQIPKQRRVIILMYGITGLVLIGASLAMNWGRPSMGSLVWMIPMLIVLYVFTGIRAYRQRKSFIEGFSLTLDDDVLIQNQPKYPELRIPSDMIINVDERSNGLVISVRDAKNVLGISKDLLVPSDYEEIRAKLLGWVAKNKGLVVDLEDETEELEDQIPTIENLQAEPEEESDTPQI